MRESASGLTSVSFIDKRPNGSYNNDRGQRTAATGRAFRQRQRRAEFPGKRTRKKKGRNESMARPIIKKECITTDRLTLRPYRKEDAERLVEMMRDPKITATFMVPDYPEEAQYYALADKLIAFSQVEDTTHLEYGVCLDGKLIGFVNDCGHDENAIEVGYVIDPAYQGRGFATEALQAVLRELREMGFKKVLAGFFEGNLGSRRVMEKCGLRLNGNEDEEDYRGKILKCYECEMEL